MCECIKAIEANHPDHRVDTAVMFGSGRLFERTYSPLMRRDNGRKEGRNGKPSIAGHSFCPFCGEKYTAGLADAA